MNPPLHLITTKETMADPPADDFFSAYLSYSSDTEVPINFHRWAIISALGAFLGRQYYFQHGAFSIHPNMYTMLIGSPGTRKSTAIKLVKKLLNDAGYETIAADKTSKEKFNCLSYSIDNCLAIAKPSRIFLALLASSLSM